MDQDLRTKINRKARGENIDPLENVIVHGKSYFIGENDANFTQAEGEIISAMQQNTRLASSSEEYHTSQQNFSARKRVLKQRDRSSGFRLPPELRSSSRLASKSAVYQFSETSSEDSGSYPAYSYVELNDDSPAIDVVLTHRCKDGGSK